MARPKDRRSKAKTATAKTPGKSRPAAPAQSYHHPDATSPMRPDVGTQPQFKKKKPPKTYRYDSSLSPALDWDGQNPAREQGEALIREILDAPSIEAAKSAAARLKALGRPFLNWAGKAERLSFDVPTLPLFIHERLSTTAIIKTLSGHKRDQQQSMLDLFGDPQHSVTDQALKAYEHQDKWVNRLVLGDALVVMNSLLRYENLGGQVQMIYMDPPYGVKFGSNFQSFVRKRDVTHGDDADMTREPEMVQAYRDTWELGLHSYLTYLRDRLLLARDLLTPSGSIFVQISDENLHHVREIMDEVFGAENAIVTIVLKKKGATTVTEPVNDFILWYAKDKERSKSSIRRLFEPRRNPDDDPKFNTLISPQREMRRIKESTRNEIEDLLNSGWRWARVNYPLVSQQFQSERSKDYFFNGKRFTCGRDRHWSYDVPTGMDRLAKAGRLFDGGGQSLGGVVFWDDWPYIAISNVWNDLKGEEDPIYVVQTSWKAIQRCILMTTSPGDLVLDPTCGSGTTAYVAEQWGRRWITIDASRVPLALARQRLLTATYPWYELKDEDRGPGTGFLYKRKQNGKGEEVGGIVPQITLNSIANSEPAEEKVLVDRPEIKSGVTRVAGPFCVEATIPTPVDWEADGVEDSGAASAESHGSFVDRMLEVLRKSPVLRLQGNKTVTLRNVRRPARTLSLSAEALVDATAPGQKPSLEEAVEEAEEKSGRALPLSGKPVALVFGPENGAISAKLVENAAREANGKHYSHLYVIGFAIESKARETVEHCEKVFDIPATYVQASPDLTMGDLLKNMRSSQIFSVCGLPDVKIHRVKDGGHQVELLGLDVFDPSTMQAEHRSGDEVPAWFLDTDYNGLCFHVSQAFFPRTGAWDSLKKALKGDYEEGVWEHLSGTTSAPFAAGEHKQVAVKVIDDRGNELLVVKAL